jgi:hypothetical protein
MTNKMKWLVAGSSIAVAALGATPALATPGWTPAGTTITNTANMTYTVGATSINAPAASVSLTVDRRIVVKTAVVDTAAVATFPGEATTTTPVIPALVFTVTNSSNAIIDIDLAAAAQASGATAGYSSATPTAFNGTTTFAAGNTFVFHTGSAVGPVITYIDEAAIDSTTTIYVVDTAAPAIPLTATNGQTAGVTLTATALSGNQTGTKGSTITNNALSSWNGGTSVYSVFAETAGSAGDPANDGKDISSDVFTVQAPSVVKTNVVVWDPINLTTSPKAIPGAIVRYCIIVSNPTGAPTMTAPGISDTLPAQVKPVAGSLTLNGTSAASTGPCNTSYATFTTGSGASGTVATAAQGQLTAASTAASATLANLTAGSTETLYFDVTIN